MYQWVRRLLCIPCEHNWSEWEEVCHMFSCGEDDKRTCDICGEIEFRPQVPNIYTKFGDE